MRAILILLPLALAACTAARTRAPPPAPTVIEVPVKTYVPIDKALTARCKWMREGKPSQVFEVSNGRKRCLVQYESQFEAIEQVQGGAVP
ncbi:hypothetical protein [Stenotrophomonas sp. MMGLT7]|uniref:hypothetical protein n=1 Tax=Stenotrophomonas sp. MMGLT7 TaxID=2901227 RepID=UPI001E42E591|nr:hypothetical protein [Stenotrophomonas sp. MMGLT7]MCD7096919.1 hypothetical protein [Stenotrophomonas sp. MMGLT7]